MSPIAVDGAGRYYLTKTPRSPGSDTAPMDAGASRTWTIEDLVDEVLQLAESKGRDYGTLEDPYANVRSVESWGIPGWVGAMMRVGDKLRRLQTYQTKGTLSHEGVEDSLLDSITYCLIALALYRQDRESG